VQFLLERHTESINATYDHEKLASHVACADRDNSLEKIRLLVEANPFTVLCQTDKDHTPLQSYFDRNHLLEIKQYRFARQREAVQIQKETVEETSASFILNFRTLSLREFGSSPNQLIGNRLRRIGWIKDTCRRTFDSGVELSSFDAIARLLVLCVSSGSEAFVAFRWL